MGKGSGDKEAKKARQAEEKRQSDIRAGTARINSIFDGSTAGDGLLGAGAAFDPTKTYYGADGKALSFAGIPGTPGSTGGGGVASTGEPILDLLNRGMQRVQQQRFPSSQTGAVAATPGKTPAEQFADAVGKGGVFGGTKQTGGFGDSFFADQRKRYIDYATPQLEDQYGDAQKELTFSLARSGNLNSSARSEKVGDLQKMFDLNKQKIADDALSYETQARNNVEDARASLIAQLNATGDATGTANSAIARSRALSQPAAFSPIANLFSDFTSTLGTQAAMEQASAQSAASGGTYKSRYNLFGSGDSVRTTR